MKTYGALLVLCCCLAETQLRGETISDNDITHQGHYGEAETRENEVMGAAQKTENAATAYTQQTCQPDIHTVLREMSALVAEQRVELRHTKTQMEAMETRLTDRLRASENKAETMETRLRASESLVERLKSENKAQSISLNLTVSQVEELRREREERRVSFSASLLASGSGNTGPFSVATPVVYRHIFTNVGNAYNPNTGVFTAPVRGVYNFALFAYGHGHASTRIGVSLHKNGEHVVLAYTHHTSGQEEGSAGNGASLLLEVGDVVYVKLWPNCWVRANGHHPTTFSGHLLFPM